MCACVSGVLDGAVPGARLQCVFISCAFQQGRSGKGEPGSGLKTPNLIYHFRVVPLQNSYLLLMSELSYVERLFHTVPFVRPHRLSVTVQKHRAAV